MFLLATFFYCSLELRALTESALRVKSPVTCCAGIDLTILFLLNWFVIVPIATKPILQFHLCLLKRLYDS